VTVYKLNRGTLVTYNDVPSRVEGRAAEPLGYWLRSIRDPQYLSVASDREIEQGIQGKGGFRMGASVPNLPGALSGEHDPDPQRLSPRDHLVRSYRQKLSSYIEDAVKDAHRNLTLLEAAEAAVVAVPVPRGVKPVSPATAAKLARTWANSGRRPLALAPKNAWKGNRTERKPGFVLDAVEDALDSRYAGKGTLPRVISYARTLAQRTLLERSIPRNELAEAALPLMEDGEVNLESVITPPYVRARLKRRSALWRATRNFGPEEAKKSFDVARAGPQVTQPLAVVEGDDVALNGIFVIDDRDWFPLGFPYVTFLLDRATQACVGRKIGPTGPNSDTVARAMAHAVLPKDLSDRLDEDGNPLFSRTWPMNGPMSVLKCDMGSPYLSHHVEDAAYRCGTVLHPLPPASPKLKGSVERFIRSFKEGDAGAALQILPRRLRRALKPVKGPLVLTLSELERIIDYWIVEIYHESPHFTHGLPPRQAWEEWTAEMPVDPPPGPDDLAFIFGRYVPGRTINKNGIRLFGLEFNSDALGVLRESHGDLKGIIRDVELKYDPEDLGTVWALFRDPDRPDRIMAVPAYCKQMRYARGLSEFRHSVITAYAKENSSSGVITMHQLMDAKAKLAKMAERIFAERDRHGGSLAVGNILKAHRSYLLDPSELPEDTPGTDRHMELLEHDAFPDPDGESENPRDPSVVVAARAVRTNPSYEEPQDRPRLGTLE
jgi:transposase InsO family protein